MSNDIKCARVFCAIGAMVTVLATGHAHAIGITTTSAYLDVEVRGGSGSSPEFNSIVPTIPMSQTDTIVAADGMASSSVTYAVTNNPGNASFNYGFDLSLSGGQNASASGLTIITLSEAVNYTIGGSMTGTAKDASDAFTFFFRLTPLGGGPTVDKFSELEVINATSANMLLGDGIFDQGSGSTIGMLTPGDYQIVYQVNISDNISGFGGMIDGDMNATASLSLLLTAASASVPEPGTLAILGLGLAGLGFARRRKAV